MSWLANLFGAKPEPKPHLILPKPRQDLPVFEELPLRVVPAEVQAMSLVALFQVEGRFGPVPHYELMASYAELAIYNGFREIPRRQILVALSQLCAKKRLRVRSDEGEMVQVWHYVIPAPSGTASRLNVLPIRNKGRLKPQIRSESSRSGDVPWPELPAQAAV